MTGSLGLSVTARTPLLIGGFTRRDVSGAPAHDLTRRGDGSVMIPGSGRHGAIRSVHESLMGNDKDILANHLRSHCRKLSCRFRDRTSHRGLGVVVQDSLGV